MALRDAIQRLELEFPCYGRGWRGNCSGAAGQRITNASIAWCARTTCLLCLRKRKFVVTTASGHGLPVYAAILRSRTFRTRRASSSGRTRPGDSAVGAGLRGVSRCFPRRDAPWPTYFCWYRRGPGRHDGSRPRPCCSTILRPSSLRPSSRSIVRSSNSLEKPVAEIKGLSSPKVFHNLSRAAGPQRHGRKC